MERACPALQARGVTMVRNAQLAIPRLVKRPCKCCETAWGTLPGSVNRVQQPSLQWEVTSAKIVVVVHQVRKDWLAEIVRLVR